MKKTLKEWIEALGSVLFPDVCQVCGVSLVKGEKVLCTHCNEAMSRANFHLLPSNQLLDRLVCHAPIERAAALFFYVREDPYAGLIHKLKYNRMRYIGIELAKMFADEIEMSGFFNGIDVIVPVPMHWVKELRRGYNQSRVIAEGLSCQTGIPVGDCLVALKSHSTQTRKGAAGRWENSEGIYGVKHIDRVEGKHILVVDDVVTTGATLIHCCEALYAADSSVKISVLTLAATRLN